MKNIYLIALFGAGLFVQGQTIRTSASTSENRWTYGGGAGFGISGGSGGTGTTVSISPRIGYRLTDNLEAGLATGFTWGNSKYYSTTMFGAGPYANLYFGRSFYISSLFQHYWYNLKDKYNNQKYSADESALYLGAGYMQRLGNGAYMQIGASYNVLYKENESIFSSGFVPSIGVVFGL